MLWWQVKIGQDGIKIIQAQYEGNAGQGRTGNIQKEARQVDIRVAREQGEVDVVWEQEAY